MNRGGAAERPKERDGGVQATGGSGDVTFELIWDTPGDPDQTDDSGTDMDLYYLHPGTTAWDDVPGAIYWRNRFADWGALDDHALDAATTAMSSALRS